MHRFLSEQRIIYHADDWRPENEMFTFNILSTHKTKKNMQTQKLGPMCMWRGGGCKSHMEMRERAKKGKICSRQLRKSYSAAEHGVVVDDVGD